MTTSTITIPHAKPSFFYVDALAGAGKTFSAHSYIAAQEDFFTIATQTNDLSDQQARDLAKISVDARVIKQERSSDNCTKMYVRHCKDRRKSVALINQKVALQEINEAGQQHLLVDEFPSPVTKFILIEDLTATRAFISKLIKAVPCEYPGFLEVIDTEDTAEIAEFAKTRTSSVPDHLIELSKKLHSRHYRSFVSVTNYEGFRSGLPDKEGVAPEDDDSKRRMVIYSFVQPSVLTSYKSVTFMGANFAQSKLFAYWQDKVEWVPHASIKGTRYDTFAHKAPLISLYHTSEQMLSWSYLDKKIGYDVFTESVASVVAARFPDQDHIVTMSAKSDGDWQLTSGKTISPNPVGLNAFQHINLAVHLAPLLPSNSDQAIWMAVAGLSPAELFVAQAIELIYQCFTRTSIRDGKHHSASDQRLIFIGLDRASMEFVGEMFGVDKPSELIDIPALTEYVQTPRKTRSDKMSDQDRREARRDSVRRCRAKKAAEAAAAQLSL